MIPTFYEGDMLYASAYESTFDGIDRGDVVVFVLDGGGSGLAGEFLYVKRVIGLPGEKVVVRDGGVEVDGEVLVELYARGETNVDSFESPVLSADAEGFVYNVPEGEYFVLGDNRSASLDSRNFVRTYVPGEWVMGKFSIVEFGL
jgi:signal peptidase I